MLFSRDRKFIKPKLMKMEMIFSDFDFFHIFCPKRAYFLPAVESSAFLTPSPKMLMICEKWRSAKMNSMIA